MDIVKDGRGIQTVDQWFDLAAPKRGREHWVDGRSALECARAWCGDGKPAVPAELLDLLASNRDTTGAVIRWITPEQKVHFDALPGEPRNADVVGLADHPAGLIAINIEAKADEPFDLRLHEVLENLLKKISADEPTNGVTRIQQLASSLLTAAVPNTSSLGDLRYQLLTGLAGAVAFAIAQKAPRAAFLIHEFVTDRTDDAKHDANARDLDAFVARLTSGRVRSVEPRTLLGPLKIPGHPLFESAPAIYLGKAVRNVRKGSSNTGLQPELLPQRG